MFNRSSIRLAGMIITYAVWLILPTRALSEKPADEPLRLELVSELDAIVPGKEFWLGILFDLRDGWHTYWVNPGDSGEAPRIEWHLPAGFQAGPIQWPYPARLLDPPFADYGYEHEVLLMAAVLPPPRLTEGEKVNIAAGVHYLVCHDVCIPGHKQLDLTLPVRNRAAAALASPFKVTRQRLPRPAPRDWKISATSVGNEFVLNLRTGKLVAAPQFFPLDAMQIENAAPQRATTRTAGIRLHLMKSKQLLEPASRLKGVVVVDSGKAYLVDVPVSQPLRRAHTQSTKDRSRRL